MSEDGATGSRAPLYLLVGVALACRLVVAGTHEVITNDSASYLRLGESLATAGTYIGIQGDLELKFPPGYPALIALVMALGVPLVWAGRLVVALAGALLVLPAFALGRRLGGPPTGWVAAILVALTPPLVWAGSLAIAEVVLALFTIGALALIVRPGTGRALGAGALLGFANLVKPEAFAFLTVGMAAAAWLNRGSRLGAAGALLGGFLLVSGPWIGFLNSRTDPLLLEGKSGMYGHVCQRLGSGMSYAAAAAGLDGTGELGPLVRFNDSVGRFVYSRELLAAPRDFAACWVHNAERIVDVVAREAYFHPVILLAAVGGALRGLWAGGVVARTTAIIAIAGVAAVGQIALGLVTMWIAPRYLLPSLVLVTILAAHGISAFGLARWAPGGGPRVLLGWGALAITLGWWAPVVPRAFGERLPSSEREVRAAIIADAGGRRPFVMSRFALPSFYANGDWVQTPVGATTDVVRFARREGVTHLVSDGSRWDALAAAVEDPAGHGLRLVSTAGGSPGVAVLAPDPP